MGSLDGKVAIITGATSGIGARTAEVFVREGARVLAVGRRRALGEALVGRLGPAAQFFEADVAEEASVKAMVDRAMAVYGKIDCLFNNAGMGIPGGSITTLDMDVYDRLMRVNLRGVTLGMKHASVIMLDQVYGSIINTGSVAGLRTGYASQTYSAAKAAVIHLTRCVAAELGEKGIRVNSISPGAILTGIFGKVAGLPTEVADTHLHPLAARFAKTQPIPRAGLPDDIASAAVYLASDASSFVNGHDLVVDGGLIGGRPFSVSSALGAEMGAALREAAAS